MAQRFEPDDIYLHHAITSVHCVPSLSVAACTVVAQDREKDTRRSAIWAVPFGANGEEPRQLTAGTDSDNEARWSPDGEMLAFLSDRAGSSPQIYLQDRNH